MTPRGLADSAERAVDRDRASEHARVMNHRRHARVDGAACELEASRKNGVLEVTRASGSASYGVPGMPAAARRPTHSWTCL